MLITSPFFFVLLTIIFAGDRCRLFNSSTCHWRQCPNSIFFVSHQTFISVWLCSNFRLLWHEIVCLITMFMVMTFKQFCIFDLLQEFLRQHKHTIFLAWSQIGKFPPHLHQCCQLSSVFNLGVAFSGGGDVEWSWIRAWRKLVSEIRNQNKFVSSAHKTG